MTPKVIHCCWLGGEKSPLVGRCCESWRRFAPDWKVRVWTLDEVRRAASTGEIAPVPPFFEGAIGAKKWAFAADWVRFAVLLAEGGLYLDCDVELVKPLDAPCEFVSSQWLPDGSVGLAPEVISLDKGSAIAREMVDFYAGAPFDAKRTIGEIMSEVLHRTGLFLEVLPPEVFCPIGVDGVVHATERTIGIHHCEMSWAPIRRKIARWLSWHGMRPLVDWLLRLKRACRSVGRGRQ